MNITVESISQNYPHIAEHFRAEGARRELDRVKGVSEQTVEGYEAVIKALMFDGKTTPEQASIKVAAAMIADTKVPAERRVG